ncbi:MAG: hypothetical protein ACOYBX_10605 [Mycobacterium sp.]
MAGPYPPYQPVGSQGQPGLPQPYPGEPVPYPSGYPGPLPPPVGYSTPPRRRRALWWSLGALALVGALVAAVLLVGGARSAGGSAGFTDAAAKTAIQDYLTALSSGDTEAIARNNSCGMFDALKERRSDMALARLGSDAFRKQFSSANVTSIDKIVPSSSYQAQVLFTMKVARTSARSTRDEEQGVAQLLRQDNQILVCSYLLRTSAQY